jgi:nitroreductase
MMDVILKRFEKPDETRVFQKGKLELVVLGGMTIGRASYEPGWKWYERPKKPRRQAQQILAQRFSAG